MTWLNKYDKRIPQTKHANGIDAVPLIDCSSGFFNVYHAVNGQGSYFTLVKIEDEDHLDQLFESVIKHL